MVTNELEIPQQFESNELLSHRECENSMIVSRVVLKIGHIAGDSRLGNGGSLKFLRRCDTNYDMCLASH